ncbi:MAG TPA: hypothetical protein PLQ00_17590, partial [Thermoguttaceae bacterium]|nr:hypothetical protein [Thermoguttaceae bacterium]
EVRTIFLGQTDLELLGNDILGLRGNDILGLCGNDTIGSTQEKQAYFFPSANALRVMAIHGGKWRGQFPWHDGTHTDCSF